MCCGGCSPAALCCRRCCCCSRTSWYSTTASTAPMPMSTSPAILSPPAASCLRRARFRIQIESGLDSESDPPRPGPTQKTGNGRATHSYTVRFAGISKAATTCCLATVSRLQCGRQCDAFLLLELLLVVLLLPLPLPLPLRLLLLLLLRQLHQRRSLCATITVNWTWWTG